MTKLMLNESPEVATVTGSSPVPHSIPVNAALIPENVPLDASGAPAGEACPPPLVWQEVLNAYRADSQPWEVDRGSRTIVGRVWGQGPPLYLLNGFVATAEMYALLVYLLRDTFRCVVFDTFNRPAHRSRPSIQDQSEDVLAVADHHGDASIRLFAASSSSPVAIRTALDHPDRVSGMILQHGFARRRLSFVERLLAGVYQNSGRSLGTLRWRRRVQEMNHRRWFPPFDGTRFEFLLETTGGIPLRDLAQTARAVHAVDLTSDLPRVACPVLLLRTEGQGVLEAVGHEQLEKHLPHVKSEWMHSTGLHPCLTHPHRVAKLLKTFLLEQPTGSPAGT
jgi:pimeloyl-ACP methyl ester carboxylesterase